MVLYFITGNANKFAEASAILPGLERLDIDLPEIQEMDGRKILEAKLKEARKHMNAEFIVEDVGLYLSGLQGMPGPLVKWFLKTIGNTGIYELTTRTGDHRAEVKAIIGYAKNEEIHYFEGSIMGTLVAPIGAGNMGTGWEPIFKPDGYQKTFAQMTLEEKNAISHRRRAFDKLKAFLAESKSI